MVSQVYHGIGHLCLAHDPSTSLGQIGVLVDCQGLSAFKLPPFDVISNGIAALGKFFGHRAGRYYLINCPRGVYPFIKLVALVMGGEQRRKLRLVKSKERDAILRVQAATHLDWPPELHRDMMSTTMMTTTTTTTTTSEVLHATTTTTTTTTTTSCAA